MSQRTYTSNIANGDPLDNNKQLVITRADMTTDFTDDEYQACIDAMSDGFSVVIHYSSGGLSEATLTKIRTDGALVFTISGASGQLSAYTVAPGSIHLITNSTFDIADTITPVYNSGTKIADIKLNNVSSELYIPSNNDSQFVLNRADMTVDFTDDEYQNCVNAINANRAVCVQFNLNGITTQIQLSHYSLGSLVFDTTAENYHYRWVVDPTAGSHSITFTMTTLAKSEDAEIIVYYYQTGQWYNKDGTTATVSDIISATDGGKVPIVVQMRGGGDITTYHLVCYSSSGYIQLLGPTSYLYIHTDGTHSFEPIDKVLNVSFVQTTPGSDTNGYTMTGATFDDLVTAFNNNWTINAKISRAGSSTPNNPIFYRGYNFVLTYTSNDPTIPSHFYVYFLTHQSSPSIRRLQVANDDSVIFQLG